MYAIDDRIVFHARITGSIMTYFTAFQCPLGLNVQILCATWWHCISACLLPLTCQTSAKYTNYIVLGLGIKIVLFSLCVPRCSHFEWMHFHDVITSASLHLQIILQCSGYSEEEGLRIHLPSRLLLQKLPVPHL